MSRRKNRGIVAVQILAVAVMLLATGLIAHGWNHDTPPECVEGAE